MIAIQYLICWMLALGVLSILDDFQSVLTNLTKMFKANGAI